MHALRVFEVAARLMSFTEAARELHVTQTAVSHQIKALEGELGVALFRRGTRQISLTPDGRAWAQELAPLFARLHEVHRRLRGAGRARAGEVALSIIPSFASRWLVPRLGRFLEAHPDVDLRISTTQRLVDFATEPVDLGIRYGRGSYPGLAVEKVADDAWVVVAAPALLARHRPRSPRDLGRHTLLHDDERGAWSVWLARQGLRGELPERRTEISDSSMLAEAAVRGQGVALARWSLVVDDIAAGRLHLVFPDVAPLPTGMAYRLAAPRENLRRPVVAKLWAWVLREAEPLRRRRLP
jgi:LysR family glycine cleavage system transcriptional activator